MKQDWQEELKTGLAMEDGFFSAMNEQLTPEFEKLTGEALSNFLFFAGPRQKFQIRPYQNGQLIAGELLNIDYAFPVQIVWEKQNSEYHFRWLTLPADQIKNILSQRRDIPIGGPWPFEVIIQDPVWPHLNFLFFSNEELDLDAFQKQLGNLFELWNAQPETGKLHNMGKLVTLGVHEYQVHFDLGRAGPDFLEFLFSSLADFNIEKIILDT